MRGGGLGDPELSASVRVQLREFARLRDWEQFHHPKNLAMAVAAEAGELVEVFQWLSDAESRSSASNAAVVERARDEIADVLIYLVRLADVLDIVLEDAVQQKIAKNEVRYPVSEVRGSAMKRQ